MAACKWRRKAGSRRCPPIAAKPSHLSNYTATSDGIVELCYGEVDDVLNLLSAVTALPGADAQKVLMLGYSHGSCITERAIERGAKVHIAVSIDGPTDFMTWPDSPPLTAQKREARSSVNPANNPAALKQLKFLRIQAAGDTTVPPTQACELAERIGTENFLFDSSKNPPKLISPSPPLFGLHRKDVCSLLKWARPGLLLPWPRPGNAPASAGDVHVHRAQSYPDRGGGMAAICGVRQSLCNGVERVHAGGVRAVWVERNLAADPGR